MIQISDLYIFDQHDNLLTILSNEADEASIFWDALFKEELNQSSSFSFNVSADHPDSQHVVAENQVAFKDKDDAFRLFVIREIEETESDKAPSILATCEPAMLELNDEIIEDKRPQDVTAESALTDALAGTRYKVGIVASLGLNSTNFYYINATEAIEKIINTWGGELRDRIEVDDTGISGRYIDILTRRGADTGKRWEMDKDIVSISHIVQSYPKTALYGRGSSVESGDGYSRKTTFADVEWSKANGDPVDKPLGQEWVGDPDALQLFGRMNDDGTLRHRKGRFEDGQEKDPEKLLDKTWDALQKQKTQLNNFELDVYLLGDLVGYDHEKVRLGDSTIAINRNFAKPIEIEARVISFEYDVADPGNTGTVEMGKFIDLFSDDERLDQIESRLNDGTGIWNQVEDPIDDTDFADEVPPTPSNFTATGLFKTIKLDWDFVVDSYIAAYEVYASQVKGFTPDSSNLVWRGKSGGYAFKADFDQQWYFKIRAINTHDTPSAFSTELSAQTQRAGTVDFQDLSVTKAKLGHAAVDTINIADAAITNAKIESFTFDKGYGGILTLGGLNNQSGILHVVRSIDDVNEIVGSINAGEGEDYVANFQSMFAGKIYGNNIINALWESLHFYVDPINGDDNNSGLSWSIAKKTIQSAIDSLPKYVDRNVTIEMHYANSSNFNDTIHASGIKGRGEITVNLKDVSNTMNGWVVITACDADFNITGGTINTTKGTAVEVSRKGHLVMKDTHVYGNNQAIYGIGAFQNSYIRLDGVDVYDVETALMCGYGSQMEIVRCKGKGSATGVRVWGASHAGCYQTYPGGGTNNYTEEQGGIFKPYNASADFGAATPPPAPETTDTWTASSGAAWRPDYSGQWAKSQPLQGEWSGWGEYKGCWFFGSSVSNAVTGKTISNIRVYITRDSQGGYSSKVPIRIRTHNYTSQPSGQPSLSGEYATVNLGWGDSAWVDLPSSMFNQFESGSAKGIGVYFGGGNEGEYAYMKNNAKIEITYQ